MSVKYENAVLRDSGNDYEYIALINTISGGEGGGVVLNG